MARALIGIFVVAAIGLFAFRDSFSAGVPVDVDEVTTGPIETWIEERAKTRLPEIHRITMPLPGRIRSIDLEEGTKVAKGQIVAEMDVADLDSELAESLKQVNQQEQLVRSTLSMIQSSQAQIEAREAKLEFVAKELERKTGAAAKAFSDSEKEAAKLLKVESEIDVTKDKLQLSMYEAIQAYTKLGLEDAFVKKNRRERDRGRAELKSPVDGVVLKRHESSERFRPAGEVLLELGNLSDLEIEAEILTQDAVTIPENAAATIEGIAPATPSLPGSVVRIDPRGFTKISSLGVEQQRVLVIIRFEPKAYEAFKRSGRNLGVDYRVRVRIFTGRREEVARVTRSALFRGPQGDWQCFVVRDGHLSLAKLELGLMNDFDAEVRSGIRPGDRVVIAPESSLAEGAKVAPRANTTE